MIIDLPKKSTPDASANVPMRGIEPAGMPVREEVSLVEGRMFQFGTNEVIVGRGASGQFVHLNVGDTIVSGQNRWQVVGIFEADGGVAGDRGLVRRAHAAGRLSARQHVSVGARAARVDRVVRHVPRLAHVEPAAQRA